MSTVLAHAALGALGAKAVRARPSLVVASVVCACLPDVDVVSPVFGVAPDALLAHRGFTHGFVFAALLAACVGVFFRERRLAIPLLFAAVASHGVLDAMTYGGPGVALFSPVSEVRVLLPLRPLPALPLGLPELFGRWGLAVIGLELLLVVLPAWLALRFPWPRVAIPWLIAAVIATPSFVRPLRPATDLALIPAAPLEQHVAALRPLFGQELKPLAAPWSSSFFPYWLGGEAGRWQDSRLTLLTRTLTGFEPSNAAHASPTEKYDLAHGDVSFTASRASLALSHNRRPRPRFWFGLCNGVAAASLAHPEPFRAVDVTSPDGQRVRFLPNDVKALLAAAYYQVDDGVLIGDVCEQVSFDPVGTCSMNPATLVLATLNGLGLQHRSFLIDVHPTPQAQYFAVASARVNIVHETSETLEVELEFSLSSTLLDIGEGNVSLGDGTFQKVGVRPVHFSWRAALSVDGEGRIAGGRWLSDGPDFIVFISGGPKLKGDGIDLNPALSWSFIQKLAEASAAP